MKIGLPTILIVEDDPAVNYLMRRYAEKCGCRAVSTCFGQEALTLAGQEKPAVIVLDIAMPEMNGWQVLHGLKNNPRTRDIPVVLCAALHEEHRERTDVAGYLRKPVMYWDFVSTLVEVGIVEL